jgi:hypothetical protein
MWQWQRDVKTQPIATLIDTFLALKELPIASLISRN